MNEEQMLKTLLISSGVMTVISGVATVGLLVLAALQWSLPVLIISIILALVTAGCGWAVIFFGDKVGDGRPVFTNAAERETLGWKQKRTLRQARGDVVMQRALIEVQQEQDNILHRQQQELGDPDLPPYETRWTELPKQLKEGGPVHVHKDEPRKETWER